MYIIPFEHQLTAFANPHLAHAPSMWSMWYLWSIGIINNVEIARHCFGRHVSVPLKMSGRHILLSQNCAIFFIFLRRHDFPGCGALGFHRNLPTQSLPPLLGRLLPSERIQRWRHVKSRIYSTQSTWYGLAPAKSGQGLSLRKCLLATSLCMIDVTEMHYM